ncbi:unnamed protein product, partial [Closterium sp. NIES-53]
HVQLLHVAILVARHSCHPRALSAPPPRGTPREGAPLRLEILQHRHCAPIIQQRSTRTGEGGRGMVRHRGESAGGMGGLSIGSCRRGSEEWGVGGGGEGEDVEGMTNGRKTEGKGVGGSHQRNVLFYAHHRDREARTGADPWGTTEASHTISRTESGIASWRTVLERLGSMSRFQGRGPVGFELITRINASTLELRAAAGAVAELLVLALPLLLGIRGPVITTTVTTTAMQTAPLRRKPPFTSSASSASSAYSASSSPKDSPKW